MLELMFLPMLIFVWILVAIAEHQGTGWHKHTIRQTEEDKIRYYMEVSENYIKYKKKVEDGDLLKGEDPDEILRQIAHDKKCMADELPEFFSEFKYMKVYRIDGKYYYEPTTEITPEGRRPINPQHDFERDIPKRLKWAGIEIP